MKCMWRSQTWEFVLCMLLFCFYLYCYLEYLVDSKRVAQSQRPILWVSRTIEKPYDPRDYVVESFAVDLQKDLLSPTKESVVRPNSLFQIGTKNESVETTEVPQISSIQDNSTAQGIHMKPTPPKRPNPLFVGPVEDDFSLDDPYFNHNGNVSSFMETYTKLHNELTSSKSKRIVVYLPMKETGLGNSLLALSSSFFYAVLTKRAFLLNYAQFTRHFTFSFKEQNSSYTFTKRPKHGFVNWNRHYGYMQPSDKSMRKLSPRCYCRSEGVIVTGFLAYLQYIIRHDNYILKLARMGFVDPNHINYSIPINVDDASRKYDSYYTSLSMDALAVFLTRVLKPQPWIQEKVDAVLNPWTGMFLIGFHIRMGTSGGTIKDSHIFLHPHDVNRYADHAVLYMERHHLNINNTRWLISTDSDNAERVLREIYGDLIVTSKEYHRGHSKTGARDADGFSRAVIDLLILAHCDYLVLTSHSTYSVMARTMRKAGSEFVMMSSRGYHSFVCLNSSLFRV